MLRDGESCGLGKAANGGYYFVVQRYYEDFMGAATVLYERVLKDPHLPK